MQFELQAADGIVVEISEGAIAALRKYAYQHPRAAVQTNRARVDKIVATKILAGMIANGRVTVGPEDL
jgi:hypothetical protein